MPPKKTASAKALEKAVAVAGSPSALAKALGESPQTIWNWRDRGQVPAGKCKAVEAFTGISAEALRPDVFVKPEAA